MSLDKTIELWPDRAEEPSPKAGWPGWETVKLIGRGSFGAVYEIQRNIFGEEEKSALKVISIPKNTEDIEEMYSDGYDEKSITETFRRHLQSIVTEYSLMRKMNGSPNVVHCEDVRYIQHDNDVGWDIYIKMELLTPLTKVLPDVIQETMVIKLAKDMCAALELCKQYGIIHRDIKPQNIFLSKYGDYKLGDFGIAKTVEKTSGGTKIGTFKYMAPEVYNNKPYGVAADIYSLGLVLYWMLNERRMPFLPLPPAIIDFSADEVAKERRLAGEKLPPPAHGSQALKRIVLKACAYEPKDRYSSATEMLQDLKKLTGEAAPIQKQENIPDIVKTDRSGAKTIVNQPSTTKRKQILPWLLCAVAAVAVVIGLLMTGILGGKSKPGSQQMMENPNSGWQLNGGNIYYYEPNGQKLTSCMTTIEGEIYAFDANGVMQTGWYEYDGSKYYLQIGGQAVRGWYENHYFDDAGRMLTGQNEIDGKIYCFDQDGICRIILTVQPEDCTVPMGEKARIFLAAEGEELTYTWWASDVGDTIFYQSKTIFGTSYNVRMDEVRNGRKVYCIITDCYGNTLQSNTVTIKAE